MVIPLLVIELHDIIEVMKQHVTSLNMQKFISKIVCKKHTFELSMVKETSLIMKLDHIYQIDSINKK